VPRRYVFTAFTSKHVCKLVFRIQRGKCFRDFNLCKLSNLLTLKFNIYIIKALVEPLCYKEVRTYSGGTGVKRRAAYGIPSWTELDREGKTTDRI
jgi:hypothetical protein